MRKTKILAFALAVIMVFSMVSVSAFATFTSSTIEATKTAKGDDYAIGVDFAVESGRVVTKGPASQSNGNISKSDPNNNNVFENQVDGAFGYATKFVQASGTLDDAVAAGGTNDDNNNCFQFQENIFPKVTVDQLGTITASITIRWAGEIAVQQIIAPVLWPNGASGRSQYTAIGINADGGLYAEADKNNILAYVDSESYHTYAVTFKLVDGTEAGKKSYVMDVYFDGTLVAANAKYNSAFVNMDADKLPVYQYIFFAKFAGNKSNYSGEATPKTYMYLKNAQLYKGGYSDINNSGNTVEGYDLTLGSNLELNYYMNLLPTVVADADAKVQFTIGEEVVAEKKVSEVTPDAKGLYKFTCPVNSTQMATDIKVSIESTTREYKVYVGGTAHDEYAYKVVDYAKTVLAGEFSAETKALVKAMLNYGAYAQTYFAEKNDAIAGALANADCAYTEVELNAANFGTGTVTGATEGMTATLVLDTDTVIKIYKDGALVGESEGITADKLDEDVEIGTVKVSVLTLAGKVPTEKTNFKNLAKALALYSQATEAYKAAQ